MDNLNEFLKENIDKEYVTLYTIYDLGYIGTIKEVDPINRSVRILGICNEYLSIPCDIIRDYYVSDENGKEVENPEKEIVSYKKWYSKFYDGLLEVPDWEPIKMDTEKFKALLDELDGNSLETLKEKNARYSTDGDCLHNFRSGADIAGGTPAQACWGYMTKHLVALRDMVEKNNFSNREDFLEKCQDTINYIRFLWCIGNEENDKGEE